MEAGNLDDLPPDVFVRGFIRSYARTLGISSNEPLELLDQLLLERGRAAQPMVMVGQASRRYRSPASDRSDRQAPPAPAKPSGTSLSMSDPGDDDAPRRGIGLAVFVIIVLLIATITLSLFLRQQPQSGERISWGRPWRRRRATPRGEATVVDRGADTSYPGHRPPSPRLRRGRLGGDVAGTGHRPRGRPGSLGATQHATFRRWTGDGHGGRSGVEGATGRRFPDSRVLRRLRGSERSWGDLAKTAHAAYALELCDRLCPARHPDPPIFAWLDQFLTRLTAGTATAERLRILRARTFARTRHGAIIRPLRGLRARRSS